MKSMLFIIYLVVFSILTTGGFLLSIDNISVTIVLNTLISVFSVVGAIGYVRKLAIYSPNFWAGFFYLAVASVALSCIFQILEGNIFVVAFVVILQTPLLVALKRYSSTQATYWFNPDQLAKAASLQSILSLNPILELSSDTQSVKVSQTEDSFTSTINRLGANGNEEFTQSFPNLASLIQFVEIHTKFRAEDFAEKYA